MFRCRDIVRGFDGIDRSSCAERSVGGDSWVAIGRRVLRGFDCLAELGFQGIIPQLHQRKHRERQMDRRRWRRVFNTKFQLAQRHRAVQRGHRIRLAGFYRLN
jgi:hypothetical protein